MTLLGVLALAGCGEEKQPSDSITPPAVGECRVLTPEDLKTTVNDTPTVPCGQQHTAETFFVGTFSDDADRDTIDEQVLGAQAFEKCQPVFTEFVGGDDSLVMRSTLTWAWYRPSERGWKDGARWLRCDVVGGGEQSDGFAPLPTTVEGVLLGRPDDRWMVCAKGADVNTAVRLPCAEKHNWRAVATVVLGRADDKYPGDKEVEAKTRAFCSDQVGAYLGYPVADYDFGFTWFGEGEWEAGNRRSICWAQTKK